MTQPRFVLPGDTVMVTRRTLRRHHLFRPDSAIRKLYLYTLAVCAKQLGILVHVVTLMRSTFPRLNSTQPSAISTKAMLGIRETSPDSGSTHNIKQTVAAMTGHGNKRDTAADRQHLGARCG